MGVGPRPETYTITSQEKQETLTGDGRFVEQYTIKFSTPSGTHSYIRIPAAQYEPASVDAAIRAELSNIEGVHALGSVQHMPEEQM